MKKFYQIENKVPSEILKMLNITEPPVDPFEIAQQLEISVKENLDWDKLVYDGMIYLNKNNEPEIWINPIKPVNRQKFTLAHEIGHLANDVLPHLDKFKDPIRDDYTTLQRGGYHSLKEVNANKFAAQLLMPKFMILDKGLEVFEKYKQDNNTDKMPKEEFIKIMANIFEVSQEAMKYRLINLGIIEKF